MRAAVRIVGRDMLQACPAALALEEGSGDTVVVVNRDVFPALSRPQRLFILAHELGHRLTGSADERVADAFALGLTAGRQRRSLKTALEALNTMHNIPLSRLQALYALCLQVDKKKHDNNR